MRPTLKCQVLSWRAISIIRINKGVSTKGSYRAKRFVVLVCVYMYVASGWESANWALIAPFLAPPASISLPTAHIFGSRIRPSPTINGCRTWRPRRETWGARRGFYFLHTCIASTGSLLSVSGSLVCNIATSKSERIGTSRCERARKPQPFLTHLPHTALHDHDTTNRAEPRKAPVRCPA